MNSKDFMSMLAAAKALGLSRQGLWARVKKGTAPAHVIVGGRTIFERADVERHMKRDSQGGGGS